MTYTVLMGTLNPTHSLTHSLTQLQCVSCCCRLVLSGMHTPTKAKQSWTWWCKPVGILGLCGC